MKRCPRWLLLALPLASACTNNSYGYGIGRPPVTPLNRTSTSGVAVSAVYAAAADPSDRYVEVTYAGPEAPLSLAGYRLCQTSTDHCVLPTTRDAGSGALHWVDTLANGAHVRLSVLALGPGSTPCPLGTECASGDTCADGVCASPTELTLVGTAGDVALVSSDGTVQAYLAWGADPAVLGSALAAGAIVSGVTSPGVFVHIPYPMPTDLAVAQVGNDGGCFTATLTTPDVPDTCPTAAPVLRLTEACPYPCPYFAVGSTQSCTTVDNCDAGETCVNDQCAVTPVFGSAIEVENPSADALPLYGVRVCFSPGCLTFAQDAKIGALSRVALWLGVSDPAPGLASRAGELFFPAVTPLGRAGELAIVAPSAAAITSGSVLQSFVRYGSTPSVYAPLAAEVGLWPDPLAAARGVRVDGESLSHDLTTDISAAAWNPAEPTLLLANLDIRPGTDLWDSCSFPRPWREAPASNLVISKITRNTPPTLTIDNRSEDNSAVTLSGMTLALGSASFDLSGCGDLASGTSLTVTLTDPGTPSTCDSGALSIVATLDTSGEAALIDASGTPVVRQYLLWTDATAVPAPPSPVNLSAAVTQGVWPLERCTLPALAVDGSFTLSAGLAGHAPPDYQ